MSANPLPPLPRDTLFPERSGLGSWLKRFLPADAHAFIQPKLVDLGRVAARQAIALGDTADRNGPRHIPFDPLGNRIDRIEYHPAYLELQKLSYGAGMVNVKYDPETSRKYASSLHQMGFSMTMVFSGGESGMLCPLCMTDGAARVVKLHGSPELKARAIPCLAATDMGKLWRGAMFLTEKQGGSDVGANTCRAVNENGTWRLYGDKWFCSNVDAEVALVLARSDDAPKGTKGLSLFYVETNLPEGGKNNFVIHRIKDKFGTRSMPTGEITFNGTPATLLGGPGAGFKQMLDMVNLSRLYNATVSVGLLHRALDETTFFAERRMAFGTPLTGHRMHLETLADWWAHYLGGLALVLTSCQALDEHDTTGDKAAFGRSRMLTPMAKRHTGRQVVDGVSMCMELIGGQGYIEDTGIPRLLRDGQVLPIWEGTSHIQMWDVARAALKDGALMPTMEWLAQGANDAKVKAALDAAAKTLVEHADPDAFGAAGRYVVDQLTNAVEQALLVRWGDARALLAARRLADMRSVQPWKAARTWSDTELKQLCGIA
ncbi:MAG: acyl-CoA dehydrogenase family protein [Deltaproteobacteria bacterium]|nr:acyl-CoA dehydrogenase family protein [Deltaproteobacteria bacterium]